MRAILALSMLVFVSACSANQTAVVVADATSGLQSAQTALNFYGTAKGMAEVAELAVPSLAPALMAAIGVADPIVVKLQADVTAAQLDLPAIASLVAQINAQAQQIEAMAAPVIKVVPSTPGGA